MTITPKQLQTIRDCAKDDASYRQLVALIEAIKTPPPQSFLSPAAFTLNLSHEQVQTLMAVLDTLPVAVYIKDLESRFVLANRYAYQAEGFTSLEALIGKTDFDIDPEGAQHYFDTEQDLMKTGKPLLNFEDSMVSQDGTLRWNLITKVPLFDEQDNVVGLIGIHRDITERKLAQSALEDERKLLRTVVDHIPDKIYIKDRDSRFVLINERTFKDTRYFSGEDRLSSLEEIIGKTDFEFMSPERAKKLFDEEQAIMRTGEAVINQDYFLPKSHIGARWFLVTKVPVYDEHGEIIGLVGINRDVTDHKTARQKELELTLEKERSAILEDFITKATHEFRTGVAVLQSSAYLLKKATHPEKREMYVERILERVNSLLRLINDLITMTRLDKTEQLDLKETRINQVLEQLQERIDWQNPGKHASMEFIVADNLPDILADADHLETALYCVISNALAHTPKDGRITVKVWTRDENVGIEVSDTGIGMSKDIRDNIFKRFYRADDAQSTSGFGLGLPIAQRIVELHHGKIEVESDPDKGSMFRILLPCNS